MSGDIVNLRRWRKEKAREQKKSEADQNAARHGVSRAVTDLTRAREERDRRTLDGHRIDAGDTD